MCFVGIDPGKRGGIALLPSSPASPMPEAMLTPFTERGAVNLPPILDFLEPFGPPTAIAVESVHAMPGQGVSAMFSFGKSAGGVEALSTLFDCPHLYPTPQSWMKHVLTGYRRSDGGGKPSVLYVQNNYPSFNLTPGRCTKPQDGLSDAICLAEFAKMSFLGLT